MNTPNMLDMLKAGVHFGHKNSKWHPNMEPYIFTTKQNVHILDLEKTQKQLEEALTAVRDAAARGKTVLFVGTKRQAAPIVEKHATLCDMPYVNNRWLGGTLTNFSHVIKVPRKLTKLKSDKEKGALEKYTKKEQLDFEKEIEKLEITVGGLENMEKMPDMVFIVDVVKEKTALEEARQKGVKVIAMCDSNANPRDVDFPIPANDDAVKSIEMITKLVGEAVLEGQKNPVAEAKPEATKAAEKKEDK